MSDKMDVHFSSKSDMWETPQKLFDELNAKFNFTLDVCALPENAKCKRFFCPAENGLSQDWKGNICWMNPPYGRGIKEWVKKAWDSSHMDWQHSGATTVCLLPARTDTSWWHDYCMRGEITFLRGRLKFGSATENAPFPNAIVIFHAQGKAP